MHAAAALGDHSSLLVLLLHGADPSAPDERGQLPLELAVSNSARSDCYGATIHLLLRYGAAPGEAAAMAAGVLPADAVVVFGGPEWAERGAAAMVQYDRIAAYSGRAPLLVYVGRAVAEAGQQVVAAFLGAGLPEHQLAVAPQAGTTAECVVAAERLLSNIGGEVVLVTSPHHVPELEAMLEALPDGATLGRARIEPDGSGAFRDFRLGATPGEAEAAVSALATVLRANGHREARAQLAEAADRCRHVQPPSRELPALDMVDNVGALDMVDNVGAFPAQEAETMALLAAQALDDSDTEPSDDELLAQLQVSPPKALRRRGLGSSSLGTPPSTPSPQGRILRSRSEGTAPAAPGHVSMLGYNIVSRANVDGQWGPFPLNVATNIRNSGAQLVALHETLVRGELDVAEDLGSQLGMHVTRFTTGRAKDGSSTGMAVLTRGPVVDTKQVRFPSPARNSGAVAVRVRVAPDGLRSVHTHNVTRRGTFVWFVAARSTATEPGDQAAQSRLLLSFIGTLPGEVPIFVCGDFNWQHAERSQGYKALTGKFRGRLQDAEQLASGGLSRGRFTYPVRSGAPPSPSLEVPSQRYTYFMAAAHPWVTPETMQHRVLGADELGALRTASEHLPCLCSWAM